MRKHNHRFEEQNFTNHISVYNSYHKTNNETIFKTTFHTFQSVFYTQL